MLSKDKKNALVDRIVESNTFKNAPTSIALLRYLVEANIEARFLKESIIDIEFFGADPDENKNNPRVRVNVFNLRKKLRSYYWSEGAGDSWQIKIEKGQYSARFVKQGIIQQKISVSRTKQLLPYSLLLLCLAVLIVTNIPQQRPAVWDGFFTNKQITNLFVGDAFGYRSTTITGSSGWARDFNINSLEEYYEILEENPELKSITSPSNFYYSTRMAENATHDLARFFTSWGRDFEIKYATQTSFSDIKKGNTIYIGRLSFQKDFTYLFNEGNQYFEIRDNQIHFFGNEHIPDTTFDTFSGYSESDYALVSRNPGPNNTEQFFFFSNHDIGVMGTVEYFTNPDSLKAFNRRYLKEGIYFIALYKAGGQNRINLSLEEILVVPFD